MTATTATTAEQPHEPGVRPAMTGWRWFALPLGIYLASRVVTALFLAWAARSQAALPVGTPIWVTTPLPASPSLLQVSTNWDGQWYWQIVLHGYPHSLPPAGSRITQTPLAFYPGYPTVVRELMGVTGAGFPMAAVLVSLVSGGAAVVLLHRLLLRTVSPFVATANITLLCAWPGAVVMQTAYTESLTLLLLVLAVRWLVLRHYALAAVAALALGFVRPLTVPLAAVVIVHAISRWRASSGGLDARTWARLALPLVACGIGTIAWPGIVGILTGEPLGYFTAMAAWAPPGARWGGWFSLLVGEGAWVLLGLVLVSLVGFLRALRNRPRGRTWPLEVRVWSGSYVLFVLMTTMPTIGIARYALLALVPFWPFPDDSHPERPVDRRARWAAFGVLVALALAGQYWYVSHVFTIDVSPLLQRYP